jgi:ABC-2 type transport system permease protein
MKTALIAILGETRKGLLTTWTYRANAVVTIFTLGCTFIGIGFLMGGGDIDPEELASTFLGYLVWFYALMAIGDVAWGLRGEIQTGTLEQMSMSPAPVGLLLLGRSLANFIVSTAQVLLIGEGMFLLLGIRIPMRWEGLPVLALTLAGIYGAGFIVAGATLVYKQFESFANLMQNGLLFLSGALLPVEAMPEWLAAIARTLPSTQGIVVLRRVVLDGQSLASVWQDGSLIWLIVHSAIYLTVGCLFFSVCEQIAKKQGSLGQY